jgi:hypothetical protein
MDFPIQSDFMEKLDSSLEFLLLRTEVNNSIASRKVVACRANLAFSAITLNNETHFILLVNGDIPHSNYNTELKEPVKLN